ncbi:hypothetical protein GQ472_01635 [archaeon]|nr:hypothetical protein [archaeon]
MTTRFMTQGRGAGRKVIPMKGIGNGSVLLKDIKIDMRSVKPMSEAEQLSRIRELVKVPKDKDKLWVIYGQKDMKRQINQSDVFFIDFYLGKDGANRLYTTYKDKLLKKYGYESVGVARMFNFYNPRSRKSKYF